MTTQQAIEALHALPRLGQGAPGLARMQNLMDYLGNPEKDLQCIHIAGTNGKGSLAAMTSSILTAAGYKTGLTISPYVVDFRERFQIDGEMIPPRTLANLTEKLVAAITKIGLDHTEILGDTLDKIAAEKAGIIKKGCAVVNYPEQPAEAMGPILGAAAETNTVIITPEMDDIRLLRGKRLENRIDYGGYKASLQFPGAHQANHAAMAVEIALALWREFGYDISDDAIELGLSSAHMPARIEVMRRHPLLLLDGCHNPDGARVLAETLTKAEYEENLVGVMGMLADKDYKAMLSALAPCFAKVFTVTPACPRALSAEALQKEARFHLDAEAAASVPEALHKALNYCEENNLAGVVVCGSLYLAAEARPLMLKEAEN